MRGSRMGARKTTGIRRCYNPEALRLDHGKEGAKHMVIETALSSAEFVTRLDAEAAALGMDIRQHPFPQLVLDGKASLAGVRAFARNFYLLSSRGPRFMLVKLFYCTDPELSRELAENIYEEFTGKLSKTAGHMDLFARFVRAAGMDPVDCLNPKQPTPLQAEILAGYSGWREMDPDDVILSMGHINAGGEAATSANFGRIGEGLVRHYGFNAEDVEFFQVHVEADKGHGEFQVKCLERYATTEAKQQKARDYVFRSLERMMKVYNSGLEGAST